MKLVREILGKSCDSAYKEKPENTDVFRLFDLVWVRGFEPPAS